MLARALDEHETTGAELAQRAHLSRFHFDRVTAGTAGEPPGRMRLRVPAQTKVSSMDVLVSTVEHLWVAGEMLTRAGNLSDDQPIELDDLDGGEPIRWITSHG